MLRVLITEHEHLNVHRLRAESRRAGVLLLFSVVDHREDFLSTLAQRCPEVVLTTVDGLPGLPMPELSAAARRAGAAIMLLGSDSPAERKKLGNLRPFYDSVCRVSALPTLPLLLERLAARRANERERSRERALSTQQLLQTAEQVRDLQKMATVGQLAGSIAHEINNPLESITNLIYLMSSDERLPEHMRPYLELAQQELNRVAQISKQTLSYFRETQAPVRITLSPLLEEVLVLYGRRLNEKNITVERRWEAEEPVHAFPGEIRQIFANLIANAIEATAREGRIVIRLHQTHSRDGRETPGMRVTIADSGHGIPPEAMARLGQPFFTTKGQRGTGLGLWVSRTILRRYGGSMRLRSSTAPGRHGTTFSIFLPIELRPRLVEIPGGRRGTAEDRPPEEPGLQLLANGT